MFTGWSDIFQDTVKAAWPLRHKSRYNRVKVLLVSWASDDLGVFQEVAHLGWVFKTCYGYEIEHYDIPDYQASTELFRRVLEFRGNDSPDTLLNFYYGGHGSIHPDRNDAVWAA